MNMLTVGDRITWRSRATGNVHDGEVVIVIDDHPAGRPYLVRPDGHSNRWTDWVGLDDMRAAQPVIRWETSEFMGGTLVRARHDGPCVFVDRQCTCGRMDIGIVRA